MKVNHSPFINETAINPLNGRLYFLQDWYEVCNGNNLAIIRFDDIELEEPKHRDRVLNCEIRYPGILYREDGKRKLKLIDGRHRIKRLQILGAKEGMFYVLRHKHLWKLTHRPLKEDYPRPTMIR